VIVRVNRLPRAKRASKPFVGAIGDDLIRVRIGRRARARLKDVDDEVLVEATFFDILARLLDRVGQAGLQHTELCVHDGRGPFDLGQGANEPPRQPQIADGEILPGPLRAGAVIGRLRDAHLAHGIALDSRLVSGHGNPC